MATTPSGSATSGTPLPSVVIDAVAPGCFQPVCGISILERLLRTLQRCGFTQVTILSESVDEVSKHLAPHSWARAEIRHRVMERPAGPLRVEDLETSIEPASRLLVLRGDTVLDPRLLQELASRELTSILVDSSPPTAQTALLGAARRLRDKHSCGASLLTKDWLSTRVGALEEQLEHGLSDGAVQEMDVASEPSYAPEMRRELRPYWFPAPSESTRATAECVILDAAQKGALDFPAWVHGPIETFLVSYLCKTPITPNQLTIACNVVAWAATLLFATGRLGWGTALAMAVGILDGIDGKQARVKVETSRAGKLEHWFDSFYELSWGVSMVYYFWSSGVLPNAFGYLALLLGAEALDGLAKGSIILVYGRLIDELSTLDRVIRFFGGRRNVYIWILAVAVLLGNPATGFIVLAWWEAATAAIHLPRAGWLLWLRAASRVREASA